MLHREYVAGLIGQLQQLLEEDNNRLCRAQAELEAAKRNAAGARLRTEASLSALRVLEQRLEALTPSPADKADGKDEESRAPRDEKGPTTVEAILGFLAAREKAATHEIVAHVQSVRKHADHSTVSPELTRLKRQGRIVHVEPGWWQISDVERSARAAPEP
ncbi:hypothetical protein [Streptomyces caatingaensis]|uniref:Uncharacterized protein n=1 Tax=Streptomyces caatingaensis TaxID=1678637 RepID=A0A0K9XAL8_9ACTN|nr:hypothetical protein [Streptomyces caatingaensis]KNB50243.1 hypothetical protein AC230_26615 [Streptomyces caatingaensis]